MSGKFKRSQRHQRWNEEGTCWSEKYLTEIVAVETDAAAPAPLRSLASELRSLARAQNAFGEVEELRRVLTAFQKATAAAATPPAAAPAAAAAAAPATEPSAAAAETGALPAPAGAAGVADGLRGPPSEAVERGPLASACWLLAGLIFQPGSRQHHRTVLGAVKRLPPGQLDVFGEAVTERLRLALRDLDDSAPPPPPPLVAAAATTTGGAAAAAATESLPPLPLPPPPSSVPLGEVLASLLWLPGAYAWVRPVAAAAVWRLAAGVDGVLAAADRGQMHIAPGLMEEVLDAVGALYYLLQHHGRHLVQLEEQQQHVGEKQQDVVGKEEDQGEKQQEEEGGQRRSGRDAVVLAGTAMLRALQGRVLVREALASAAVVLWASSLLPYVTPGAAAAAFGQGLFFSSPGGSGGGGAGAGPGAVLVYDSAGATQAGEAPLGSWLDEWLRNHRGSSLVSELRRFSPIGRICSLKGLVTAMPKEATCAPLWVHCASASDAPPPPPQPQPAVDTAATDGRRPWHFLIDGALSYGCSSIRDAPDAHFKFHAACVLCFCVSKVLDSWQQQEGQRQGQGQEQQQRQGRIEQGGGGGGTEEDGGEEGGGGGGGGRMSREEQQQQSVLLQPALLRPEALDLLMGLVWANLDEPLAQTARQLQESFQLLLEVLAAQDHYVPGVLPPLEAFKRQVVSQLLAVPYNRKGRYAPLGCMAERGCALLMLRDHPALIPEALLAMQSDTTASAASSFLKTLLAAARTEASAKPQLAAEAAAAAGGGYGAAAGAAAPASSPWVALWRGALLRVLYGANEKLRAYVSVHALPVVLGLEPAAALELIHATLADGAPEPVPGTSRVAALVAVLKAARGMGLVADLDSLLTADGRQRLRALEPRALLGAAVGHASEAVRLDALELACVAFRMSDPPGRLELSIAGRWLALCMRSTAQGSRNKCLVLVTKLIARIRMAVAHIHHKMGSRGGPTHPSSSKGKGLQVLFSLGEADAEAAASSAGAPGADPRVTDPAVLERLQGFMQWLTRLLVSGLYPGSPYERRFFALELLSAVLEAWGPDGTGSAASASGGGNADGGGGKTAKGGGGGGGGKGGGGGGGGKVFAERPQGGRMAESTSLTLLPRGYNLSAAATGGGRGTAAAGPPFRPYCPELLSSNTVALLLAGAVDSWDKLRQAASSCLMRLPTPLPGLTTGEQLTPLLGWATGLLWSPRARESDAGARLIKILYGKYVAGCGWRLQLHPSPRAAPPVQHRSQDQRDPNAAAGAAPADAPYSAVLGFLDAVLDLVNSQVAAAREDLAAACRRSLAHGPLLLLRYVVEDVPWGEVGSTREGLAAAAGWAARALAAAEAIVELALPVLSRPQERNVGAEEVDTTMMIDDEEEGAGSEGEEAGVEGDGGEGSGDELGPEAQVILTACWNTVKEVSLVLATLVRHMPLPTSAASSSDPSASPSPAQPSSLTTQSLPSDSAPQGEGTADGGAATVAAADDDDAAAAAAAAAAAMLGFSQLRRVGDLLVRLLFEMKHNGAVDKTSLALTAVAERLLRASAPELNGMPRPWLEACIRRVLARGQSRDDIVRRSAGLPFAFGALLLAEPGNAPKALLSRGMAALLAVAAAATSPCLTSTPEAAATPTPEAAAGAGADPGAAAAAVVVVDGCEVREVWPVVHAFNCLRHAFNDGHLAVDTSGYFAPAIQACLRALRSPSWEIRNSAMLCFTALTSRVLGFKNDSNHESVRKAVSGAEFFQRYPALHGFLLDQLREAAAELERAAAAAAASGGRASAAALANPHPGLYPVLIILSRLKASHIREEKEEEAAANSASSESQQDGGQQQQQQPGQEGGNGAAAAATTATAAVATYMGGLTPVAFTPLVRRCATAAPYAVRLLAARALSPLVAVQDVPALLQQLLAGIPPEPPRSVGGGDAGGGGASAGPVRIVGSGNALHGALLQAAALLDSVAVEIRPAAGGGGGGGAGGQEDVLAAALPHLARGAWLADPWFGCSALGCALLQAAGSALRLLPPGRCLGFRSEVAALAGACRRAVAYEPPSVERRVRRQMGAAAASAAAAGDGGERGGGGVNVFASDFPDPMRSQLLKLASQLWLGPVLLCQAFRSSSPAGFFLEGLLHQLRCCLASYLYDTRAAALKSLVRFLTAVNGGIAALAASAAAPPVPNAKHEEPTAGVAATAAAAMASAIAAATGGTADAGGKLPRLVADLLARPALLRRLVSEGMALLWETVASEPVHKVTRRALKALGLLHALSTTLPTTADTTAASAGTAAEGPESLRLDPITAEPLPPASAAQQHPLDCLCCADPRVGGSSSSDAAAEGLRNALSHVALVERLLSEGCKELEARCEALRCLGRALGSATLAAAAVAAAAADGRTTAAAAAATGSQPSLVAALGALLDQVVSATQPWQPEDWRLAGVEALAASRLLQSAARPAGRQEEEEEAAAVELLAIRGWRCVITFLEDEDHAVRYTAARLAQEVMELSPSSDDSSSLGFEPSLSGFEAAAQAISCSSNGSSSNGSSGGGGGSGQEGGNAAGAAAAAPPKPAVYGRQPLYVEAVIRRLYAWLAVQYGNRSGGGGGGGKASRAALVAMLCELVLGSGGGGGEEGGSAAAVPEVVTAAAASAGAAAPVGWSSQARRLFDKEADNPHEEPLLTAQLAARTLRTLLAAPPAPAAAAAAAEALTEAEAAQLARWGALAAEHLRAVAAAVVAASGAAAAAMAGDGVGGDGDGPAAADGWLGGFVNHPEVFTCAYKALLALWSLGPARHHALLLPGDSALASALAALRQRRDVLGSQLAPLLLAVASEWGAAGSGKGPHGAGERDGSAAGGGAEGEQSLEKSVVAQGNLLFLL
ncbi:hypothetical protein PLESTB_000787500 [Pleodorina starrii]|uniref:DUF2428 domain-containing protein n=1 Tax=Pleodorina starrii TaxID=330485 RepID=A0A9W6F2U9_9CHLO|nr:hypothetical protein PLESTM_000497200 [Pleodorina starrii]GLC53790.1 hypothetical protein PLESTB_000787500 [Pleodorina starrii]GLC72970.1 hypothetical protein PLESTF_001315200 [Pleodorina starrii]